MGSGVSAHQQGLSAKTVKSLEVALRDTPVNEIMHLKTLLETDRGGVLSLLDDFIQSTQIHSEQQQAPLMLEKKTHNVEENSATDSNAQIIETVKTSKIKNDKRTSVTAHQRLSPLPEASAKEDCLTTEEDTMLHKSSFRYNAKNERKLLRTMSMDFRFRGHLLTLFGLIDRNHSGMLEFEELVAFLGDHKKAGEKRDDRHNLKELVKTVFLRADSDYSADMDFTEFLEFVIALLHGTFNVVDRDQSCSIDRAEFGHLLQLTHGNRYGLEGSKMQMSNESKKRVGQRQREKMFNSAIGPVQEADGTISREAFVKFMMTDDRLNLTVLKNLISLNLSNSSWTAAKRLALNDLKQMQLCSDAIESQQHVTAVVIDATAVDILDESSFDAFLSKR